MRLELLVHPVDEVRWGEATRLEDGALVVARDELARHLLEDRRLVGVELALARPGAPSAPPLPPPAGNGTCHWPPSGRTSPSLSWRAPARTSRRNDCPRRSPAPGSPLPLGEG